MKKVYDLAVKVGTYEKNGETKNRYENIGVVMQGDNGPFIFLKKTFNPAGVDSDRESIIVSMFKPKEKKSGIDSMGVEVDNPFSDDDTPF